MLKALAALVLLFCTSQASAEGCPDFIRFVDFGLEGPDGVIYRGGPVLRAESLEGEPLLLRDRTKCLAVREVSKDGRGNPIPVVTSIEYSPAKTIVGLTELRVAIVDDTEKAAERNASLHRAGLKQAGNEVTRGENFLCIRLDGPRALSCQLKSPYPGNIALVVYCDAFQCVMPVLALNDRIFASATWASADAYLSDPGQAGVEISGKIQQIHDFLDPLSSGL